MLFRLNNLSSVKIIIATMAVLILTAANGNFCNKDLSPNDATCKPTVPETDKYFDRWEGTDSNNVCQRDSDCVVSGCGLEVCATDLVVTTCELLPRKPQGSCGCLQGECQWHQCPQP